MKTPGTRGLRWENQGNTRRYNGSNSPQISAILQIPAKSPLNNKKIHVDVFVPNDADTTTAPQKGSLQTFEMDAIS